MNEYQRFLDMINKGENFLICSHFNPDGDAIGSTIALGMLLEGMGKKVSLYNRDKIPKNLLFLPSIEKMTSKLDASAKFDVSIMVDAAGRKRVSDEFLAFKGHGVVGCIDHHIQEKPEADEVLLDSKAASTGEVVFRLLKSAKQKPTKEFAQCIYTTLVVDTGFFKYSNTNSEVLSVASELVSLGANPWTVAKNLEESYPASRMKLLGAALATLKIDLGGRYATMDVTQEMLKSSGGTMDLSDEFAVFPRAIEGVEVSALFREYDDGRIKLSLRSKDQVDVAAIARNFGGGGHERAAGFQLKCTLEEAKRKLLEIVAKEIV